MEREERIKQLIDYKGIKQGKFAKQIGVSQQAISDMLSGKQKAGEKIIFGIIDNFTEINPFWLLKGEGSMLRKPKKEVVATYEGETMSQLWFQKESEPSAEPVVESVSQMPAVKPYLKDKDQSKPVLPMQVLSESKWSESKGVPYYDIDITAGAVEIFDDRRPADGYMELKAFQKVDFLANISGDSMYPSYRSGDIVGLRILEDWQYIPFGETYVVETEAFRMLKIVRKSEHTDHYLLCSINKAQGYDDFELPKEKIRRVFAVEVVMGRR